MIDENGTIACTGQCEAAVQLDVETRRQVKLTRFMQRTT